MGKRRINEETKTEIKEILLHQVKSRKNFLEDPHDDALYRVLEPLLTPLPWTDFNVALNRFRVKIGRSKTAAVKSFMEIIEELSDGKGIDKKIKQKVRIAPQASGRGDFEDFRLIANVFYNIDSKVYLTKEDRALIREKQYLKRKGAEDDILYICRIRGIPYEKFKEDERFRDLLFKENLWVERNITVLSYLMNKYMQKLINETKNGRKWIIDYFGKACAQWVPDWKEYIETHPKARHKGRFKKSLSQTREYLKHRDIKLLGYMSKNKHHFEETHWIRGRIVLLGQIYTTLFDLHPKEREEQAIESIHNKWRDRIQDLFEKAGEPYFYREIIEFLYFDLKNHPWPPLKNLTLTPPEQFFLNRT